MAYTTLQQAMWNAYQTMDWHLNVVAHGEFCDYYGVYFRASCVRR